MRIVALHDRAVGLDDLVGDRGERGDKVEVELAFQTLLNDLHVEHAEEAAAEAEAERDRAFRLKRERGVVQLELFKCIAQIGILGAVLGVDAAEHHRTRRTVAGQRLGGGAVGLGDGVADTGIRNLLDGGGEVADLARAQLLLRRQAERQHIAAFEHLKLRSGRHHLDLHARTDGTIEQAHIDDNALVGVVLAVEDEGAERRVRVAHGRRNIGYDALEHLVDVDVHFCGNLGGVLGRDADDVLDFLLDARGVRRRQVDLVDDRNDFQTCVDREVGVAEGLRLNALRRVNDEKRTLAGRERTRNLVVEVHVARGVDEVHLVGLAVVCLILHADGAGLDGDAALALEVHVVEQLLLHLADGDRLALLQQAVGKGGLAVVDMRNNRKIANLLTIFHVESSLSD